MSNNDKTTDDGNSAETMQPKPVPTQAELDADRAANPDTSKDTVTDPASQSGG